MQSVAAHINTKTQHITSVEVGVVGAGQAGLATGYYLKQRGVSFIILDENDAVGASWTKRWDSLRLFTPAKYSGLPGYPFPGDPYALPHKDDVAAYFAAYAQRFDLPIQLNTKVQQIKHDGSAYQIETNRGMIQVQQVVIASGTFHTPAIPAITHALSPSIQQIHSSAYLNPAQIQGERVLVVGAGSSGAQIALELTHTHQVFLAGRDPGSNPRKILGKDLFWWFYTTGLARLSRESWIGQRLLSSDERADARVDVSRKAILAAGIEWLPRVTGAVEGQPQFEDGRVVPVDAVIWATGFRADYSWIDDLPVDEKGYPRHYRGMVWDHPGLYFVGLKLQHRANSHLIGGVGEDAEYVVSSIEQKLHESA
ncbi:MAG: NAD(P)/FAD-dependent oxidoreductase [Anaerolineae bacterium]